MAHTIYSYTDSGVAFQENWTSTELKSYVKSLMSSRGTKPYQFTLATRSHNNGEATEVDVISKKTGKISRCYLAYMFGDFHCEPSDETLFVA